jgi:hypothetical protein
MAMAVAGSRYSIPVVLGFLVSMLSIQTVAQERLSERVLTAVGPEDAGFFASPNLGEEQLRFLLALIARSARVPLGFEEVAAIPRPFDGNLSTIPSSARVVLIGLRVGEALDALVSADPRYSWREQDGVILIRPVEAWANSEHFLHQRFAGFGLHDSTMSDVVKAVYAQFGLRIVYGEGGVLGEPPGRDTSLEKRMDFEVPSGTMVEALNSVVRAHGGLGWMVHYAYPPGGVKTSCLRFVTFDGKFSGAGAAACQSTAGVERTVPR